MASWQTGRHMKMLSTMLAISCSLFRLTSAAFLLLLGIYKRRRKYRQTLLVDPAVTKKGKNKAN